MLTLVLTQTLKYNRSEGIKVAITPLITDLPIILMTSLVFYKLSRFNTILGVIALAGGGFPARLGCGCIRIRELSFDLQQPKSESIKKGMAVKFLYNGIEYLIPAFNPSP
jgi:threonine/homoserine/homoserine lactone efflux protein